MSLHDYLITFLKINSSAVEGVGDKKHKNVLYKKLVRTFKKRLKSLLRVPQNYFSECFPEALLETEINENGVKTISLTRDHNSEMAFYKKF